ncbi:MAG: CoA-binding protein [Desulfobacterales bacterium]
MTKSEHFLKKFVEPESVAIIGASNNPARNNYHLVGNLINLGYGGRIYPVNPRESEISGLKTYSNVEDIEEIVDLAVIGVSAVVTPSVLEACAKKGIKRVTLIAGGFSEIGSEGKKIQRRMHELLNHYGMRAIGPNALSPINVHGKFAVSFHELKKIEPGRLSLIFQSGLYEPAFEWLLSDFNFHFSKLIDLGNKMDINEVDALEYYISDPFTSVIGIHMESIAGDGRRFYDLLHAAAREKKQVVVLKTGRTPAGAEAAASHTGAMVRGNDRVFDGALKQAGAIRVDTTEDFFDVTRALDRFYGVVPKGNRVAVAMLPGGLGVMVTDLCERSGLSMARTEKATVEKLEKAFPSWEIAPNPWDLGVTMQFKDPVTVYGTWIQAMATDPNVDMLAFQLHSKMLLMPEEFFSLFTAAAKVGKPTAVWINGIEPGENDALKWLEENQVAVFRFPEKAIAGLVALYRLTRRFDHFDR